MTEIFKDALHRVQSLQRGLPKGISSFGIQVKNDSYYGSYLEVEVRADGLHSFLSTLRCVDTEDYTIIIDELEKTLYDYGKE